MDYEAHHCDRAGKGGAVRAFAAYASLSPTCSMGWPSAYHLILTWSPPSADCLDETARALRPPLAAGGVGRAEPKSKSRLAQLARAAPIASACVTPHPSPAPQGHTIHASPRSLCNRIDR